MKYSGEIILGVLFLYVIALGVVTYDEVFRQPPHLFPPALEKQAIDEMKKFRSPDPNVRLTAQGAVLGIEDFVTVPLLVHYLGDKDVQMRQLAVDSLQKIAQRLQSGTPWPAEAPAADAPIGAWTESQQKWKAWMVENKDKL